MSASAVIAERAATYNGKRLVSYGYHVRLVPMPKERPWPTSGHVFSRLWQAVRGVFSRRKVCRMKASDRSHCNYVNRRLAEMGA